MILMLMPILLIAAILSLGMSMFLATWFYSTDRMQDAAMRWLGVCVLLLCIDGCLCILHAMLSNPPRQDRPVVQQAEVSP